MLDWKTSFRSFYYANAEPPDDIILKNEHTALLVIDIQNTYLEPDDDPGEAARGPRDRVAVGLPAALDVDVLRASKGQASA